MGRRSHKPFQRSKELLVVEIDWFASKRIRKKKLWCGFMEQTYKINTDACLALDMKQRKSGLKEFTLKRLSRSCSSLFPLNILHFIFYIYLHICRCLHFTQYSFDSVWFGLVGAAIVLLICTLLLVVFFFSFVWSSFDMRTVTQLQMYKFKWKLTKTHRFHTNNVRCIHELQSKCKRTNKHFTGISIQLQC